MDHEHVKSCNGLCRSGNLRKRRVTPESGPAKNTLQCPHKTGDAERVVTQTPHASCAVIAVGGSSACDDHCMTAIRRPCDTYSSSGLSSSSSLPQFCYLASISIWFDRFNLRHHGNESGRLTVMLATTTTIFSTGSWLANCGRKTKVVVNFVHGQVDTARRALLVLLLILAQNWMTQDNCFGVPVFFLSDKDRQCYGLYCVADCH